MSKYILPSPEVYMQGLFRKFVVAKITGQELRAERIHSQMAGFTHAMGRIESYHKTRLEENDN